ncbi:MAG TPA: hypothetical protein VK154_07140 [Chitinophagales bacterium]|nr:hypothetical protein [Chitinophagales bacterium]
MKQFVIATTEDTLLVRQSIPYNIYNTVKWALLLSLLALPVYSYFASVIVILVSIIVFVLLVFPNTYISQPFLNINSTTGKISYYHSKDILDVNLFGKVELVVNEDHDDLFSIGLLALTNKKEDSVRIFECQLGYFSDDQSVEIAIAIAKFLQFELITNVTEED